MGDTTQMGQADCTCTFAKVVAAQGCQHALERPRHSEHRHVAFKGMT